MSDQAVVQERNKVTFLAAKPDPELTTNTTKPKVPKTTKNGMQKLKVESLDGLTPPNNCRFDSSLGRIIS